MINQEFSNIDGLRLRDWQISALTKWITNGFRGIAEVATAGGKTRFALECAEIFLQNHPGGKVIIVVPTTALQDQWSVTISQLYKISLTEISTWSDNIDLSATFQVIVVNTARQKAQQINELNWNILLIADECHRYASAQNSKTFAITCNATLGITATAERDYDDGLNEVLKPNLGPIIFEYSLLEASRDEVISPFEMVNVQVLLSAEEQREYDQFSRRIGIAVREMDFEKVKRLSILRSSVSKRAQVRIVCACSIVFSNPGKRIVVFHEEIESAEEILSTLKVRGIKCVIYHSRLSPQLRRYNLRMFRSGLSDVLVCIRALDEGVDIPEAELAIIAASTSSNRQRVQRIGRVVRKFQGKSLAKIYSLYATDLERDKLIYESSALAGVSGVSWMRMDVKP